MDKCSAPNWHVENIYNNRECGFEHRCCMSFLSSHIAMWPNYLVNVGGIVKDHTSRVATSRYKLETGGRVKYKKNEASVDVIERLSAKGNDFHSLLSLSLLIYSLLLPRHGPLRRHRWSYPNASLPVWHPRMQIWINQQTRHRQRHSWQSGELDDHRFQQCVRLNNWRYEID